jgi:thermitase
MPVIEYYSAGKLQRLNVKPADQLTGGIRPSAAARRTRAGAGSGPQAIPLMAAHAVRALRTQADRFGPMFMDVNQPAVLLNVPSPGTPAILPTPTLVVEGAKKADLAKLRNKFGVELVEEGSNGKVLLRAQEGGEEGIKIAAAAARDAYKISNVQAAHPNFIRVLSSIGPSAAGGQPLWNHKNDGNPGTPGADVAALAAWTITQGKPEIRVAILDEGVDTNHPDLKPSVVAEKDFVDDHPNARPDGKDAHGTECAGVIFSRSKQYPGLAQSCSLVAVRIAKGDGFGNWISDDFKTADAVDWAWKEGQADVLSNSWGGGPPSDAIIRAIERARTKGRKNKGAVVVIATGNQDGPVNFPATTPEVLAVGASTPWDERKSKASKDGENWWGSNFGPEVSLVAPGVKIATTTLKDDHVTDFNGTSSATPHVAAAAALILSMMPVLDEKKVREVITTSADRLTKKGARDNYVGWGRLNIFTALRLAQR